MPIHRLYGHHQARRRLAQAVSEDRLPQVILIVGSAGVGKQRLALWLAQTIFCEDADKGQEPCGACRSCRLVMDVAHPDLHWIVPIPRPKAGDPDKQVAEAEESIAQAVANRRAEPLYRPPDGMAIHGVASARVMLKRAGLTPVEGRRKVFIIGEADRLVPQEANQEAANALLKVLEEPPEDTVFVLTTEDTNRILPTIRSRAAPLRLGRLPDEEIASFLQQDGGGAGAGDTAPLVRQAQGSIGQAVLAADDGAAKARAAAEAFLEAVLQPNAATLYELALKQTPAQARGDFTGMLDVVAEKLNDAAREALGHQAQAPVAKSLRGREPEALVKAAAAVRATRQVAQGNVNPQLLIASLGTLLAETL
jgi:DNA polymerase-3 subunit delta'